MTYQFTYQFTEAWECTVVAAMPAGMPLAHYRWLLHATKESVVRWWLAEKEMGSHRQMLTRASSIADTLGRASAKAHQAMHTREYDRMKVSLRMHSAMGHLDVIATDLDRALAAWKLLWRPKKVGAPRALTADLGQRIKGDYVRCVGHARGFAKFLEAVLSDKRLPRIHPDTMKKRRRRRK